MASIKRIIEDLTPKRTEEIKPNLFIQQTRGGKYRQVHPIAWDGKIRWKEQLSSVISFRFVFTIVVVLFLYWSYFHDIGELNAFRNNIIANTSQFCNDWKESITSQPCTTERKLRGECWMNESELKEAMGNVTRAFEDFDSP